MGGSHNEHEEAELTWRKESKFFKRLQTASTRPK